MGPASPEAPLAGPRLSPLAVEERSLFRRLWPEHPPGKGLVPPGKNPGGVQRGRYAALRPMPATGGSGAAARRRGRGRRMPRRRGGGCGRPGGYGGAADICSREGAGAGCGEGCRSRCRDRDLSSIPGIFVSQEPARPRRSEGMRKPARLLRHRLAPQCGPVLGARPRCKAPVEDFRVWSRCTASLQSSGARYCAELRCTATVYGSGAKLRSMALCIAGVQDLGRRHRWQASVSGPGARSRCSVGPHRSPGAERRRPAPPEEEGGRSGAATAPRRDLRGFCVIVGSKSPWGGGVLPGTPHCSDGGTGAGPAPGGPRGRSSLGLNPLFQGRMRWGGGFFAPHPQPRSSPCPRPARPCPLPARRSAAGARGECQLRVAAATGECQPMGGGGGVIASV